MTIDIDPDENRRRIVITVCGLIDWDSAIRARNELQDIVEAWGPPFDVVTDIREATLKDPSGQIAMQDTQQYLREHGMRYVVRVVAGLNHVAAQFRRGERRSGYCNVGEVDDLRDAHAILDHLHAGAAQDAMALPS